MTPSQLLSRVRVKKPDAPAQAATDEASDVTAPEVESPQYVTQEQFDTLVSAFATVLAQVERAAASPPGHPQSRLGHRLAVVVGDPNEFGLSSTEAEALKRLVRLIDRASGKDGERERRHANGREWRGLRPPQW